MRETGVFFLYLFACLILGSLLTYPLMQTGWLAYDPHRIMGRLAQVFILLGLWPFLKAMGLANRKALGYETPPARFLGALWRGWLLGAAILLVLVLGLLLLQVRVPDIATEDWLPRFLRKSIQVLIGGMLIGLLEETFFRGALYSAIRRNGSALSAILWTSFLFALPHFMKPHPLPEGVAFDWAETWQMLVHVITGVFQWKHLDSMVALFMVGIFLALVRERSGHIGWCMGLHAGSVLVIQVARDLTAANQASPIAWLTGSYDGILGWLATAWLGVLVLGIWLFPRRNERAIYR